MASRSSEEKTSSMYIESGSIRLVALGATICLRAKQSCKMGGNATSILKKIDNSSGSADGEVEKYSCAPRYMSTALRHFNAVVG